MKELTYTDSDLFLKFQKQAEELVKTRIKGTRKGLPDELNYLHSFRVRDSVMKNHHWDDPDYDIFLAALLHDIVEDGGVSFQELSDMGFTEKTIEFVKLCTHPLEVEDSTERWVLMTARLIEANNDDVWRIKLADLVDNLGQSIGLSEENRKFMFTVKAPLFLRLTKKFPFIQPNRHLLEVEMEKQREKDFLFEFIKDEQKR